MSHYTQSADRQIQQVNLANLLRTTPPAVLTDITHQKIENTIVIIKAFSSHFTIQTTKGVHLNKDLFAHTNNKEEQRTKKMTEMIPLYVGQ